MLLTSTSVKRLFLKDLSLVDVKVLGKLTSIILAVLAKSFVKETAPSGTVNITPN